jgi:hypothetical protein
MQNINVDIHSLKVVMCSCGNHIFEPLIIYRIVPSIYSQTGKPALMGTNCSRCIKCSAVHEVDNMLASIQDSDVIKLVTN